MTVDQFLDQFKDLDPVAQRIKIFEAVRDFPYQIKGAAETSSRSLTSNLSSNNLNSYKNLEKLSGNGKTTAEELLEAKEGA